MYVLGYKAYSVPHTTPFRPHVQHGFPRITCMSTCTYRISSKPNAKSFAGNSVTLQFLLDLSRSMKTLVSFLLITY